ncbi:MAG: type VI secretion system contractile sheath large subunit, partial [Gemmatimonadetes bacterium]|nr:type VI secretion system contractile sheath large subunit [Gemmatimonadota bacterium]
MSSRQRYDVRLDASPSAAPAVGKAVDREPRSVLLVGDFSGSDGEAAALAGTLRPILVDRDTVDEAMGVVGPSIELPTGGALGFTSLDDFDPDGLLGRVPHLGAILDGRDPGFVDGKSDGGGDDRGAPGGEAGDGGVADGAVAGGVDLLGQILDRAAPASSSGSPPDGRASRPMDSVRAFAAEAARHDTVPREDPAEAARAKDARGRAADALRRFLRRPDLRGLERRWRSVDLMTRRLDTGPDLHVYLVDVSRGALAAETHSGGGLEASAFGALLREGAPDGHPWTTVVLLDGTYGPGDDDQMVLAWATALCAAFGSTLLVEGRPTLAGIPSLDALTDSSTWTEVPDSWRAFRTQPEAGALCVSLPGFLLRYPYGTEGDEIETMPFEEIEGTPGPRDGLWANGSVATAIVITREADRDDPSRPADTRLTGLPLFPWKDGVRSGLLCGETAMTDGAARRLGEVGLVPVAWARG